MRIAKTNKRHILTVLLITAVSGLTVFGETPRASASCSCPANVLDLTNWKQTLPTGSGSPTEIKQPSLAGFSVSPYFLPLSDCGGVQFRAPVNGVTTSGSSYPRSELREMADGGSANADWSTSSGTHVMYIDQAITSVPQTKKHVVAGQIHDADDDVIVIRLEYPKLFIDINGNDGPVLDPNYELGKRFNVKFVATNGQVKIYYNGNPSPAHILNKSTSGCYFKAGAYTQSNCEKESNCSDNNYGEVKIYQLSVSHSESNNADTTPVADTNTSGNTPSTGALIIEAETGAVKSPMQVVKSAAASNGKYIVQAAGKKSGYTRYRVKIPKTGKYQLRGRVITPSGASNSFFYKVGKKKLKQWHFPSNLNDWTWVNGPSFKLKKGNRRLIIKKRECNTSLDALELKKL